MIDRPVYYKKIVPFIDKPFIKVLTGVRRCGKSTMMLLIQQLLKKRGVKDKQIIAINFESMAFYHLRNSHSLYTYVAEAIKSIEGKVYLFFDEVQVVDNWEEAVNSFLVDFPSDIYITGSNSQLLSSELSTLLTGRYIHIEMQGLSFQEMITFREAKIGTLPLTDLLWLYIRRGGFPVIHLTDYDEKATYAIITNINDTIVLRDIVQRHNIRDIDI